MDTYEITAEREERGTCEDCGRPLIAITNAYALGGAEEAREAGCEPAEITGWCHDEQPCDGTLPLVGPEGRIRRAREAAGLSQEGLARELQVSTAAVSRWEQGTREPEGLYFAAVLRWLRSAGSRRTSARPQ